MLTLTLRKRRPLREIPSWWIVRALAARQANEPRAKGGFMSTPKGARGYARHPKHKAKGDE